MSRNLIIALILVTIAQILTYLQLQGQFISEWAKRHQFIMALGGVPISYILMQFASYCREAFDGQLWPGRLIGFAIGAIVFAIMSVTIFGEAISMKTGASLILAVAILCIQLFWK